MNIPSIIILVVVAAWFIFSVFYLSKHRNLNGCSGCSGDCRNCASHCSNNLKFEVKK